MTIATGVFKKLALKKQTALGTIAAAGAGGSSVYRRRVTSTIDLAKATYQSSEINASQQVKDMRHGIRSVAGTINGELSIGQNQLEFEALLRQDAVAAATTGSISTITAAVTTGAAGTMTRSAGSFLTDGFKVGDVVRWTGWATTGTPNNSHNMMITALTATVMTVLCLDGVAIGAKAAGDSVTCSLAGKKTFIPSSGQTRNYFTIEHWFSDISESEVFTDCVFTGANLALPPTGLATVNFPVLGLNMVTDSSQYFTSPAAAPSGGILASVNGAILVGGAKIGTVTALNIDITGGQTAVGGVVGSNVDPDIYTGVLGVSGSMTVLFEDTTQRDAFINESEVAVAVALTADNTPGADVMAISMSRVKFTGATKNDGPTGIALTVPFTALEQEAAGGAGQVNEATTISIQDSAWS